MMRKTYINPAIKLKDMEMETLMGPGGSITPPVVGAKESDEAVGESAFGETVHPRNVWDE